MKLSNLRNLGAFCMKLNLAEVVPFKLTFSQKYSRKRQVNWKHNIRRLNKKTICEDVIPFFPVKVIRPL